MDEPILRTERLLLRRLGPGDVDAFAAMNADPEVMHYFEKPLDRSETEAMITRIDRHFARHRFGWFAVEAPGVAPFVGFVGISYPRFHAHFTPAVEVGWRLARPFWGMGYATEAGRASIDFAFDRLCLDEVVSMAVADNERSTRVMARLGMMRRSEDDFGHPKLPFDHSLRRHVLYRISKENWVRQRSQAS
ncbi:MAG: GNAT family N-acetyltransferase [Pseudomonadota bacterium]